MGMWVVTTLFLFIMNNIAMNIQFLCGHASLLIGIYVRMQLVCPIMNDSVFNCTNNY
jgi:hypothetical protein